MARKLIFFIVLLSLLGFSGLSLSEIIPIKKPNQSKEETIKKLLVDVLKPLPKPKQKIKKKPLKKEIEVTQEKKNKIDLILPKKKPLIAGSKKKNEYQNFKIL